MMCYYQNWRKISFIIKKLFQCMKIQLFINKRNNLSGSHMSSELCGTYIIITQYTKYSWKFKIIKKLITIV